MNILVCGKKDGRTFNHITCSLNDMGHTAYQADPQTEYDLIPRYTNGNKLDFVVVPRIGELLEHAKMFKEKGIKVYMYNTDVRGGLKYYATMHGNKLVELMRLCDCVYTAADFEAYDFNQNGIVSKHLMQGCYPPADANQRKEFKHDVLFMGMLDRGHEEACHRTSVLRAIDKAVGVYVTEAWGREASDLFASSKITIGSDACCEYGTGPSVRIFQVMAAGGFLLTSKMKGEENYFELEKEFSCYESPEDAVNKVKYWLSHPEEREAIAKYGSEKCLKLYTYQNRMQEIVNDHMHSLPH